MLVTDRRTDGQTAFSSLDRVCIACSVIIKTCTTNKRCFTYGVYKRRHRPKPRGLTKCKMNCPSCLQLGRFFALRSASTMLFCFVQEQSTGVPGLLVVMHSGSVLLSINVVILRPARLVLGWVNVRADSIHVRTVNYQWYLVNHPRQLSRAIPPWIGEISRGDSGDHCWGKNGEFCVTATKLAYDLAG